MLGLATRRQMSHCFEICHYQQNVPQHYYLLDTLVYIYYINISEMPGEHVSSQVFILPLLQLHNLLKNTQICCCIIGLFSEIFGNLRKTVEKCSERFVQPSEQFWKIFGNLRKVVGNLLEIVKNVVSKFTIYNKQNITCPLVDMTFILISHE